EPPVLQGGDEEVTVESGGRATLTCHARGKPEPSIRWIREDYNRIRINSSAYASDHLGSHLVLSEANQRSGGGYLCIASNGHPPTVSKRVMVHVNYAPIVSGGEPEVWSTLGSTVTL
ncbi:unnamed protein product, partial [Meganyctiphanes norvegica]